MNKEKNIEYKMEINFILILTSNLDWDHYQIN